MKKKVIGLLSGLSALLVTSTAFTVAWFMEGDFLTVNDIEISIRGDKELKISVSGDEGSYKEDISKDELNQVEKFIPVSSMGSSSWINEKQEKPSFVSGYAGHGENPIASTAESGFFSQELYLFSSTDDLYATIDKDSIIFEANEEMNKSVVSTIKDKYPNLSDDEILENLNNIKKSLRISILVPDVEHYQYVIVDPFKEEDTYFGGVLDLTNNGYYDYYSKGGDKYETVYGELSDRNLIVYDEASSQDSSINNNELLTCFDAKHKAGVKIFNKDKSIANGLEIEKEKSMTPVQAEVNLGIPVYINQPNKIILSIYLEGWDKDNTNLSMYSYFKVGLKFKISEYKGEL